MKCRICGFVGEFRELSNGANNYKNSFTVTAGKAQNKTETIGGLRVCPECYTVIFYDGRNHEQDGGAE